MCTIYESYRKIKSRNAVFNTPLIYYEEFDTFFVVRLLIKEFDILSIKLFKEDM